MSFPLPDPQVDSPITRRRGGPLAAAAACIALAALARGAHAVPPPEPGLTANCERPSYATDQLVCSTPALRALDTQLAERLSAPDAVIVPDDGGWLEGHVAWLRRRSRCAFETDHLGCAVAAYEERLRVLAPPISAPGIRTAVSCTDAAAGVSLVERAGPGLRLLDASGGLIGVALAATAAPWQPFVVATERVTGLGLRRVDGEQAECRWR